MQEDPNQVVYFAETDSRNRRLKFGIKQKDRSRHTYVIGKTGMGKSTLLENLAIQDIQAGRGISFIDPHGKTAELLLEYVPKERVKDVIYFAPFDLDNPISFNLLEDIGPDKRHLVANGLMSVFKRIWQDAWSARMEYILNNVLLALLEYEDSTLLGVNRMLSDEAYRKQVVDNVSDPSVKAFWTQEFAKYGPKYMQEAGAAIQNKIGQFIANPLIRNIIGQAKSSFSLRDVMDNKKIFIVNLSKGKVGESNTNILGSMIITKIYLAAMSRADITERELEQKPNFYLYVDEFQNFANESFADILSEARKYKLNLIVANQYVEQMTEEVRAAVFGNVGTMIAFRVGAFDAELLEKEFSPYFLAEDLVNLGFAQIYLKLMIDGVSSRPFSAKTLPPLKKPETNYTNEIILNTRAVFAKTRQSVEEDIKNWHQEITPNKSRSTEQIGSNRGPSTNNYIAPQHSSKQFPPKQFNNDQNKKTGIESALEAVLGKPITKASAPTENKNEVKNTKESEALAREKELRKVVSLSYLRHNPRTEKEKKVPTQEHIDELK
ncbi:MAG: type IV secretion system DNA-binding domain-containing protein, partial [bacterium]